MGVEHEAKLLAPPELELPDLSGVLAGVVVGTPERRTLYATYYDSDNLALARAGVTLRHRTGEPGPAWTLKLPGGRKGQALTRSELEFDAEPHQVPREAGDLVTAYLRKRGLTRTVRLVTDRTAVDLLDGSGARLAELVDDHVTVYDGNRPATQFREIELELLDSSAELLTTVVDRLVAAGCRAEPPLPKLVRALGEQAAAPPDLLVPSPPPEPTVEELVRQAIAGSADRLLRHDAGVRLGVDPEAVHQFRVATRRLRSDLRTFGSVLDPTWAEPLRAELSWLAGEIGPVRDNDVLTERLRSQTEQRLDLDGRGVDRMLRRLANEGDTAREELVEAIRSWRYLGLLDSLVAAAHQPRFLDSTDVEQPATTLSARLVRRQWRRLRTAVGRLDGQPTDLQLHDVRILAKRCRYAAEAAVPAHHRPAAKFAAAVSELQTVLGDQHDAVVAEDWLRAFRTANQADPVLTGLADRLIDVQREAAARCRADWPAVWRKVDDERLRGWLES